MCKMRGGSDGSSRSGKTWRTTAAQNADTSGSKTSGAAFAEDADASRGAKEAGRGEVVNTKRRSAFVLMISLWTIV